MFEKLKQSYLQKLERTAIKTQLDGETVYMKKGSMLSWIPFIGKPLSDWGRIYPAVNEDGSWNMSNLIFGGWRNLVLLLILLGIIAMALYGVYEMTSSCSQMAANPCLYCNSFINHVASIS